MEKSIVCFRWNPLYLQWRREAASFTLVDWQSDPEWEDGWPSVVVFVVFCVGLLAIEGCHPARINTGPE